jgi:hypothetical protein
MTFLAMTKSATAETGLTDNDTTRAPEPSRVGEGIPVKESKPSVAKREENVTGLNVTGLMDAERLRDASQSIARNAWLAFRDACESSYEDEREANYLVVRSLLDDLWGFAKHRDAPFRDMLAMLTAATKYTSLDSFDETQRDALRTAFVDLARWPLNDSTVLSHIETFAEHGIDITGPIRNAETKKFRVIVEEVD